MSMNFNRVLRLIKKFERQEQRRILMILEEYSSFCSFSLKELYSYTNIKQEHTQLLKQVDKELKPYCELTLIEDLSASAQKFLYFAFYKNKAIDICNKLNISECAKEEIEKYISEKKVNDLIKAIKSKTLKSLNREKSFFSKGVEKACNIVSESKEDGSYGIKELNTVKNKKSIHIFVNGFTNDKEGVNFKDWIEYSDELFPRRAKLYGFDWPSGKINSFAKIVIKSALKSRGNIAKGIGHFLLGVVAEWKQARNYAEIYSEKLANFIKKEYKKNPDIKINLYGHSLGARLIYFTLDKLVSSDIEIEEVFLFGGAVHIDEISATNILRIAKNIYNFYSYNDYILTYMYKIAEVGEEPIGLNKINHIYTKEKIGNIYNFDVNEFINGHTEYIENFNKLYRRKFRKEEYK